MKLEKFNKLKQKFELNAFENNFLTVDRVLYYFSFLGNLVSIIFSYFFVKNATDSIPTFFTGQGLVISLFIIIFMTGYELLKRFSFEQLITYVVKIKKFTGQILLGSLVVFVLVLGSFYLSINGSHRLIDRTENIATEADSSLKVQRDSIFNSYAGKISLYQGQLETLYSNAKSGRVRPKDKADIKEYEAKVVDLEKERDNKIAAIETKSSTKDQVQQEKNKENTLALFLLVTFMEFLILLGVGFNAFYTAKSFGDMKALMNTPKYKQMEMNLRMLHILYQNGNKKEGDMTLPISKFRGLVANQKLDVRQKDINEFITLCTELEILKTNNSKKKYYAMEYEIAKVLLEKNV
jgi:hypothetical protein